MSSPKPRRQSPAVYRRRRLVVGFLALVIIACIVILAILQPWRVLFGGDGDDEQPTPRATLLQTPATSTPDADAGASPAPSPTETDDDEDDSDATPVVACEPDALEVVAVVSQESYAADEMPEFSIQLTNTGDVDCTANVGTSTQKFIVTSGADTWWQSTDCQSEPSDTEVTLTAGQQVTSEEPVTWDRTRSSTDTCDSDSRQVAGAGGATYNLQVEIAGVASTTPVQFYLN
ncbi:MAG: hypothetical protein QM607_13065 [Microbacterium sp.]